MRSFEEDLHRSPLLCDLIADDAQFAQEVYAALCNNRFFPIDPTQPLDRRVYMVEDAPTEDDSDDPPNYWSCSWRYAGGIVADVRNLHGTAREDYIDWYCSGIGLFNEQAGKPSVGEGVVTARVRGWALILGWDIVSYDE